VLSDIDPSGQDDRETWADVADLHECLAGTIETNFAKAAHALDIRRLQNWKHLVTASVDDRLRGCRHGKRGTLNDWWEEFRLYHRKDGKVVKEENLAFFCPRTR
jgi:hypothetical protein